MDKEERRGSILEFDPKTGQSRFCFGTSQCNRLTWNPQSGALWAVVNERDELGSDRLKTAAFMAYSYFGSDVDTRVSPPNAELVASAIKPDYALGAHTASLGLTFYTATLCHLTMSTVLLSTSTAHGIEILSAATRLLLFALRMANLRVRSRMY